MSNPRTRISKAFVDDDEQLAEIDAARRSQWSKPVPSRDMTEADTFEVGRFYKSKSVPWCVAVLAIVPTVLFGPQTIIAECWPSDHVNFVAVLPEEVADYQEISEADWRALWFPAVGEESSEPLATDAEN